MDIGCSEIWSSWVEFHGNSTSFKNWQDKTHHHSFSSFLIHGIFPTWAMILVRPCQPSWFQHLKPTSSISVRSVSRKDPECGLRSICFLDAGACANARNPRILPPWHVPRMLVKQCHKPRCSWFNPSTWWWLGFFLLLLYYTIWMINIYIYAISCFSKHQHIICNVSPLRVTVHGKDMLETQRHGSPTTRLSAATHGEPR